jgi:hypothetical protein
MIQIIWVPQVVHALPIDLALISLVLLKATPQLHNAVV